MNTNISVRQTPSVNMLRLCLPCAVHCLDSSQNILVHIRHSVIPITPVDSPGKGKLNFQHHGGQNKKADYVHVTYLSAGLGSLRSRNDELSDRLVVNS